MYRSSYISDHGLYYISECLQKLTCLETVYFGFMRVQNINEEGLNQIIRVLKRLDSLRSITMKLNECSKIKSKELKKLRQTLKEFFPSIKIDIEP